MLRFLPIIIFTIVMTFYKFSLAGADRSDSKGGKHAPTNGDNSHKNNSKANSCNDNWEQIDQFVNGSQTCTVIGEKTADHFQEILCIQRYDAKGKPALWLRNIFIPSSIIDKETSQSISIKKIIHSKEARFGVNRIKRGSCNQAEIPQMETKAQGIE